VCMYIACVYVYVCVCCVCVCYMCVCVCDVCMLCMSLCSDNIGPFYNLGGASGKEPTCQYRKHKRSGLDPWVGKIPRKRKCHSSILAWEIPRTEQPGGLQSMAYKE